MKQNIIARKRSGFTLFEVLVAIAIISIGFLAVFGLHSRTLSLSGDIRFYINASLLAQQKLAEMEISPDGLTEGSGTFDDVDGYAWATTVTEMSPDLVEDTGTDLKKVDLTITFRQTSLSYDTSVIRYVKGDD